MEGVFEPGNLFLGSPGALVSARLARTRRPQRFPSPLPGFHLLFCLGGLTWSHLAPWCPARAFSPAPSCFNFLPSLDWAGALRVRLWGLEYEPPCPQAVV